ncbi:MAG TPA: hypothetical protein VFA18_07570 [Gemmataceae bacterium]|nr:hypothetical protein [Gemmataceae bacterium]
MSRQTRPTGRTIKRRQSGSAPTKSTRQAEQPTTAAQEWGQRQATGEMIESAGQKSGTNPARDKRA